MRNILEPFVYAGFGFLVYLLVGHFTGYWDFSIFAGIAFTTLIWGIIYWIERKASKNEG
jgi:hypothetical protein